MTRMEKLTRRRVIQHSMLAAAGLALLPEFEAFAAAQQAGGAIVPFDDIPENFQFRRPGAEETPGANALGIDLREQAGPKTPVTSTYIVSHYGNPAVDAATWTLTVAPSSTPLSAAHPAARIAAVSAAGPISRRMSPPLRRATSGPSSARPSPHRARPA